MLLIIPIFKEKNHITATINTVGNVYLDEEIIMADDYSCGSMSNSSVISP